MKKIKKCMALILAMIMALAMSATAFAAEEGAVEKAAKTGNLTVTSGQSLKGQKVTIFKLFDYDDEAVDEKYVVNTKYQDALVKVLDLDISKIDPAEVSYTIYSKIVELGDSKELQEFANKFTKQIKDISALDNTDYRSVEIKDNVESCTFESVSYGYYLVLLGGTVTTNSSLTFVDATNNKVEIKAEIPVPEKEAKEPGSGALVGSVQIGDVIQYDVTTKIPDTGAYNNYVFKLYDTLSEGLDFVNDAAGAPVDNTVLNVTVKVDGADQGQRTATIDSDNPRKMTLDLSEIVNSNQNKIGKEITVSYYAKVNENATIENTQNEAKLEYSNDPTTGGTGESIPDVVKTPTFALNVHKYEKGKESEYLAGAVFKLYTDENYTTPVKVKETTAGTYVVAEDQTSGTETMTTAEAALIGGSYNLQLNGLKEGTYYLKETKAPDSFSNIKDPVEITITKTGTPEVPDYTVTAGGNDAPDKIVEIENRKDSGLPETGGVGTVLFTLGGAILLAGIVISFIVSRKRSAE